MPYRISRRDEYPNWIAFIFIFNLIVGTGALTLPGVFAKAGWLLSSIVVIAVGFVSFLTVTFVIEAMSCANAVMHWRRLQFLKRDSSLQEDDFDSEVPEVNTAVRSSQELSDSSIELTPLFSQSSRYYVLDNKIELGEMAGIFFNDIGRIIFYLCIAVYLYGDLSIYSAAVAKSLRDVICISNSTNNTDLCWKNHTLSRLDVYRLSLTGFAMILGPFTFSNVQKTKYIQMLTVVFRWLAFIAMIGIAIYRLITKGVEGHPPMANIRGLPPLFGASVYSFMCHHSLPSLIAPISDKTRIKRLLSLDFSLITTFYLLLTLTGLFAFAKLEDLYTLNFIPTPDQTSITLEVFEYFLALFPVFTLSASFPIIAITLRNNLQTLFLDMSRFESYNFVQRRIIFPLLAVFPPIILTYFTENLTSLVSFTGSYAGMGIQYLIPIALVFSARRTCTELLGQGIVNDFRSPFKHIGWIIFVFLWSIAFLIPVTINLFTNFKFNLQAVF